MLALGNIVGWAGLVTFGKRELAITIGWSLPIFRQSIEREPPEGRSERLREGLNNE